MTGIKNKHFFIGFIVAVVVFLSSPVYAKTLMADIVCAFQQNQQLGKDIIKKIKFKLAKEQNVGGNTEKYVLEGSDGNRWLFKVYGDSIYLVKESMVFSRLSTFFGIKTPSIYEIELVINKKLEYGSLQKMLPNVKVWDSSFLCNISPKQVISFQKQHVLDWLIYNGEVEEEEFLLDTKTSEIIPIDRDEIFCSEDYEKVKLPNKDPDMFWYNNFFKEVSSKKKIDCTGVFEMIDYIQSTDDEILKNILKGIFGKRADFFLRKILPKKHNLRRDFEEFYQELSRITGKNISIPPTNMNNNYAKAVLENMKEEILNKKESISKIELDKVGGQENIEVISSKDAWYLLYSRFKYASKDEFLLRVGEVSKKLEKLKDETRSVNERYAITLYVNQIKKIKQLLEIKNIKISRFIKRITICPLFKNLLNMQNRRINSSPPKTKKNGKNGEKTLMNKIICLFNESQKLDKKIVKKLRFKLCENQNLVGINHKYLLKSNNNDLWLFKLYHPSLSSQRVKVSRCVYLLAQLLGISTPVVYEISLPINGKMRHGLIQKFIYGAIVVNEKMIKKLSDDQIRRIQNHWVFDWLIFNTDSSLQHFLIEPKTKEIIAIDKDLSLCERKVSSLSENTWNNTYCPDFWNAYINNKINTDFEETYSFIEYIQSIEKNELIRILSFAIGKGELMEKFFLRRANLNGHFEKLYYELSVLRGEPFQMTGNTSRSSHLISVLGKIKNIVLEKRQLLENLKSQKKTKQSNIIALSSSQAWFIVSKFNGSLKRVFSLDVKRSLDKLKYLEGKNSNIYEKLAINLYMEEIIRISMERDIENFLQRKIQLISLHPGQIKDKKILNREYIFRVTYGKSKKSPAVYKRKLEADSTDILSHFEYIQYPGRVNDKEGGPILKEYENWVEKNPENLMYKLFYGILSNDLNYLKRMKDNLNLKYSVYFPKKSFF